jgi:cobalt-zinc-cadmium resistance protein CzcA
LCCCSFSATSAPRPSSLHHSAVAAGTFIGLTWRGIPANLLSLGAMDFGIIVDGAVIVVENVFRRLGELKPGSDKKRASRAPSNTRRGSGAPDLLLDAHHHRRAHPDLHAATPRRPHLRADGLDGDQRADRLAALLAHARAAALPVPAAQEHPARGKRARALHQATLPVASLRWALDHPKMVILAALAGLGAASLALAPRLGTEFLPELNEGRSGSTPTCRRAFPSKQAREYCRKMRDMLHKTPEVGTVISKSGRPEDGTDPKPINMAESSWT